VVKGIDGILDMGILVIILLLIAFSLYAMWDSEQVRIAAAPSRFEVYKPTAVDTVSFEELRDINPEVFSWLVVYGTNIDYPVVQAKNNDKYVNTDVFGNYSLSGSIFLDADNDRSYRDFNSILYGHHMEKGVMFGDIGQFSKKDVFDAHKYGNLFFDGEDHGLEFFAFLHTTAYNRTLFTAGITDHEIQRLYLDMIVDEALYTRDIGITTDDRLLLLTTCSSDSTNGRDILVARITDTVYEDTFIYVEEPGAGLPYPFDELYKHRACILTILVLLIILALIASVLSQRRMNRGR